MAPTVVVGVGAGIAAYKAAILVRALIRAGAEVHVVPTTRSLDFVGRTTWEGLTGRPALTGASDLPGADHVELARRAELIVVAPATADLIARLRAGLADDLLTTTVLAADCPVLLAPAMHSNMWTNPATRDNIAALRERGVIVIDPDSGALGSGDSGVGRLPDPEAIADRALEIIGMSRRPDDGRGRLDGKGILITAGGTREAIDPVRFIGNLSSGRQGIEIAKSAFRAGARVTLVASNIESAMLAELDPAIEVLAAPASSDVEEAVMRRAGAFDAVVMAAAIADFRPARVEDRKIKKDPGSTSAPTLRLVRTTDVLHRLSRSPQRPPVLVGFAAETGEPEEVVRLGKEKAVRKGADLLAVNRVGGGAGFGEVDNEVWLVDSTGALVGSARGSKSAVAQALVVRIADLLARLSG